jgi:colanic acid/amylovoran biosynthesis glycosyltransferase
VRIAFVLDQFPVLSQTFVLNQITGLIDRGHDVDIFAGLPRDTAKTHPDVARYELLERTTHWPERPRSWALRALKVVGRLARGSCRLAPALRALNVRRFGRDSTSLRLLYQATVAAQAPPYDIILAHFGKIGRETQMLREIGALSGKLVTVFHGYDLSRYLKERGERVYDRLLAEGDLSLPISDHWRALLLELGASPERTVVHRMGIDCRRFEFLPRRAPKDGKTRVLSIARLVEKKGIEYAIRAIAQLIESGHRVDYRVVGDGPLRSDLERLISRLQVGAHVHLVGWKDQEELVELMKEHHLLLAPSVTAADGDQEGLPVVLMEAMAHGLPIVSTLHTGIPELVKDGETGYLVRERDANALADRLERLILAPESWAEMGRRGRQIVETEFDIQQLNDRLVAIFEDL